MIWLLEKTIDLNPGPGQFAVINGAIHSQVLTNRMRWENSLLWVDTRELLAPLSGLQFVVAYLGVTSRLTRLISRCMSSEVLSVTNMPRMLPMLPV
ncbi:predicted protein [Coccidioides posadasii str. Silveira]|uniref:Predicted protein n=1 Tax=Coccidioides posadasii (strain RMSCC 757 / Silveira) TaxID=443226 RepID=E9D8X8_COCPS|nr:predicted protein [Coccidioides posadasii str. Silveira]